MLAREQAAGTEAGAGSLVEAGTKEFISLLRKALSAIPCLSWLLFYKGESPGCEPSTSSSCIGRMRKDAVSASNSWHLTENTSHELMAGVYGL